MNHKAGEIFVPESGEYSDYHYLGVFRVLRDFDTGTEIEVHREEHKTRMAAENNCWDAPDSSSFVAFLVMSGVLEEMEHVTEHLGSYGELEIKA